MAVVKCAKCGKVFNTEGATLKPIGDGAYVECCPKCGSTRVYSTNDFIDDDDRRWEGF
jgi:DNA-directed RNA polymerase subunit RPC12/RpoP